MNFAQSDILHEGDKLMSSTDKFWNTVMTSLEERLKEYVQTHPSYRDRTLTAEELADFTLSMLSNNPNEPVDDLSNFFHGKLPLTIQKLLSRPSQVKPGDFSHPTTLANFFGSQPELGNVSDGFDISVMRIFRYMPAQWHSNQYATVFYCVNGKCPILLSDETVHMQRGDVMILAPNTVHVTPCYDDEAVLVYYIIRTSTFYDVFWRNLSDVSLFSDFFKAALSGVHGNPYLLFRTGDNETVRSVLYQIYQEVMNNEPHANHMANSLMGVLFLTLFRYHSGHLALSRTDSFRWKQEYAIILKYIQEHYITITMEDLIVHFHYSERQLNRIIQTCSGRTFSQLRTDLRMRRAADLISQTDMPVQDVCDAVGYTNLTAFYKAFTKYTGASPVKWRKAKTLQSPADRFHEELSLP